MNKIEYSLVIPCYNEAEGLHQLLDKCAPILENPSVELILVDNGSSDGTGAIFERLRNRNITNLQLVDVPKNLGYGHGILSGLSVARGSTLGWTHADLQTDPNDFLEAIRIHAQSRGKAFIKGKRFGRPLGDVFFTTCMGIFETILLRQRLWDINAQPTVFSRQFFESWSEPPQDFALDLFAYSVARQQKLPVARFKVLFGLRAHGTSRWNVDLRSKWKFIKRTISFSLQLRKRIL